MAKSLYDVLEVAPTASLETIEVAYQSLLTRYHPDKVVGLGSDIQILAAERTRDLNHAYEVLGNATRRAEYDSQLRDAAVHSSSSVPVSTLSRGSFSSPPSSANGQWIRHMVAIAVGTSISFFLGVVAYAIIYFIFNIAGYSDIFEAATEHVFSNTILTHSQMLVAFTINMIFEYLASFYGYALGAYASRLICQRFSRIFLLLSNIIFYVGLSLLLSHADHVLDRLASLAVDAASLFGLYAAYVGKGHFWRQRIPLNHL